MDAQEFLEVDGDISTEAAEVDVSAAAAAPETDEVSLEEEEQAVPKPVTLCEARACMAKVAEFVQVNSALRGLARFVDVFLDMQSEDSELDKTVVTASHQQAAVTDFFKALPKITTLPSD